MCPVAILKEFLCHRPPELGTTGPLYLSCVKDPTSAASLVQTAARGSQQNQPDDEASHQGYVA